ncbi:early nodulin-like protein 1 [Brachypodium distachyon]|uniref:Phytocyanin domain-containing protein n=1 Tax=Brachypodium distachyon TaxID=15368 RepID=I1HRJ0_BRADI|nr:early nodulin-like protein 1 [Brachypodium distachyon]KQK09723.1 hypothetical protein BRADI_2g49767v3 [Brachypodium distachyon]|eukprot:XP_003567113.1 early nodulin-like protein 1 [Brachypodium distachyon]
MAKPESRSCVAWFLVLAMGFTAIVSSEAYVFYAGDHDGWVVDPVESYNHWAERNRFQVGDTIVFNHGESADKVVLLVNEPDFDTCNTRNPVRRLDDRGGRSEFRFDRPGPFFFISGDEDRCQKGKKLYIVVMAVRPHAKAPAMAPVAPGPMWASAPEIAQGPGDDGVSRTSQQAPPPTAGATRLVLGGVVFGAAAAVGILGAFVL